MAYINRELVLELLKRNSITEHITFSDGVSIYDTIANIPAADVVPKSECMMCGEMTGKVIVQLQEQIAELNKRQFPSYCQAFSEEEAINTGRQYGKAEAARDIFADLDKLMLDGFIGHKYPAKVIHPDNYAELKKKYKEAKSDE